MKYLFVLLFALIAVPVLAQQPPVIVIPIPGVEEKVSPSATPEDFEHYLTRYKEDVFNPDFWKNKEITSRSTGETKKVSEFTKIEQETFIFMHADRMTQEMTMLTEAWKAELKNFDDPKYKAVPREKIENDKQKAATKEQVAQYNKELAEVRKGFAVKFEAYAESFLKNHKDLSEKEAEHILKSIRDFHDEHKLVDRQKKDK